MEIILRDLCPFSVNVETVRFRIRQTKCLTGLNSLQILSSPYTASSEQNVAK